jgi:hypothetical protein
MDFINHSKQINDHPSDTEVKNDELQASLFQGGTVIPVGGSGSGHRSGYFQFPCPMERRTLFGA